MKRLNALVVALLISSAVFAQESVKFGLKGGLNVSTLRFSNGADADWRTGFHLGALAHAHITPSFSLQPEVYYSSQGAKLPLAGNKMNLNLSYLNIPVLLQYNFANGFRLQGGPQVGFLLGAKGKVNGAEISSVTKDDFKSVDVSLPLGISYLGYSGFGVDTRYNIGLTNVYDVDSPNVKNSVFQVGVFYLFDHRHKAETSRRGRGR